MFCRNCQTIIPDDSIFCENCGAPTGLDPETAEVIDSSNLVPEEAVDYEVIDDEEPLQSSAVPVDPVWWEPPEDGVIDVEAREVAEEETGTEEFYGEDAASGGPFEAGPASGEPFGEDPAEPAFPEGETAEDETEDAEEGPSNGSQDYYFWYKDGVVGTVDAREQEETAEGRGAGAAEPVTDAPDGVHDTAATAADAEDRREEGEAIAPEDGAEGSGKHMHVSAEDLKKVAAAAAEQARPYARKARSFLSDLGKTVRTGTGWAADAAREQYHQRKEAFEERREQREQQREEEERKKESEEKRREGEQGRRERKAQAESRQMEREPGIEEDVIQQPGFWYGDDMPQPTVAFAHVVKAENGSHHREEAEEQGVSDVPETVREPEASGKPEIPEVPEMQEASKEPGMPEVPVAAEASESPEELDASEITEAPVSPEASGKPEITEAPVAPEASGKPEIPEVPEMQEAPEEPEMPEVPVAAEASEAPEALEASEITEAPVAPDALRKPEAPEASEEPETPETPEASAAPEIRPEGPEEGERSEAREAEEPEEIRPREADAPSQEEVPSNAHIEDKLADTARFDWNIAREMAEAALREAREAAEAAKAKEEKRRAEEEKRRAEEEKRKAEEEKEKAAEEKRRTAKEKKKSIKGMIAAEGENAVSEAKEADVPDEEIASGKQETVGETGPAAEETRTAAEEARTAAEETRTAAEEARTAAEETRTAAEEARMAAEETRAAAEESASTDEASTFADGASVSADADADADRDVRDLLEDLDPHAPGVQYMLESDGAPVVDQDPEEEDEPAIYRIPDFESAKKSRFMTRQRWIIVVVIICLLAAICVIAGLAMHQAHERQLEEEAYQASLTQAHQLAEDGKQKKAEKAYLALISERPEDTVPYLGLAQIYIQQQRYVDAKALVQRAIETTGNEAAFQAVESDLEVLTSNKWKKAYIKVLRENEEAIKRYEEDVSASVAVCDINNDMKPELFFFTEESYGYGKLHVYTTTAKSKAKEVEYQCQNRGTQYQDAFYDVSSDDFSYAIFNSSQEGQFEIYANVIQQNDSWDTINEYKLGKKGKCRRTNVMESAIHTSYNMQDGMEMDNTAYLLNDEGITYDQYLERFKTMLDEAQQVILYNGSGGDQSVWDKIKPDNVMCMSFDSMIKDLKAK